MSDCITIDLPKGKKIYFASDFHLGTPSKEKSTERERKIIRWLHKVQEDAAHIFLVGDIFDFWFEYKTVIPKGFVRLLGKLAEIVDAGIPITVFTGNHDMWMFGYFTEELGIQVHRKPKIITTQNHRIYIGHGDGLGPGDYTYKFLKKIFENPICRWFFKIIHPDIGVGLANWWSRGSRASGAKKDNNFLGEAEWLWAYSKELEEKSHHDYYIFGHRHLPLDLEVGETSRYINLGEWLSFDTYAVYNGAKMELLTFEKGVKN